MYKVNEKLTLVGDDEYTWTSGVDGKLKCGFMDKFNDIIYVCVIFMYKEFFGILCKIVGMLVM